MDSQEHCKFFVERKKRYCRMSVKKGKSYCGEHQSCDGSLSKVIDERIDCPLDPSHSCYQSKLSKHLKVCNAKIRQDMQPPYVVKGINLGKVSQSTNDVPLSEIDQEIVNTVLEKIDKAFEKLPEIPEEIMKHSVLESELSNQTYGPQAKRHLLQSASLLGHLQHAELIHSNTRYIEFGAGRGKLTYWLAQAIKEQSNCAILLVDRSSHRHKRDNKLKNEEDEIRTLRVRADIADLKLNLVPEMKDAVSKVAIAKHLCGAATDLTLRCMIDSIQSDKSSEIGIVIAFCCHHRCECAHYVGHKFLEAEGFSKDDFPILCKIASWATCGIKQNNRTDDSEREIVGRKVKALLNWGRVEYLKEQGFDCRLVHYTTMDVTLENMCIVAKLIRNDLNSNQVEKL